VLVLALNMCWLVYRFVDVMDYIVCFVESVRRVNILYSVRCM